MKQNDIFHSDVSDFAYSQEIHNVVCPCCERIHLASNPSNNLCIHCADRQLERTNLLKMLAWLIVVSGVFYAVSCRGESIVTEDFLDRVAWLESRGNPTAIGARGEVGAYQLRPIAIREVNRIYGTSYHIADATTPKARDIARRYLLICESRCRVKTAATVYAKYRGVQ